MSAREQARRALMIGIDAYPKLNPLEGCVNDVKLMRSVLEGQFGFPSGNITMLANEEATRDGILAAFDRFVDSVGKDDLVVIHYAGHGSQMTDLEGDEPSGRDSTIMPIDSEGWKGDNRDITDDEINFRLEKLAAKTRYTTLIFDCCHSGTISRDDFGENARAMPPDLRSKDELRKIRPAVSVPAHRGERDSGPSGWMPLSDSYVLIAGCRDEEVSYEHRPAEAGGKIVHGALTYFLVQELKRAVPGTTYRDVFERAAANVNAANGRQHPQMEGKADREIFGVRDIVPMRFVHVARRDGDVVTLAAGAALGMTPGSVFEVYPQGTKDSTAATALGEIEITQVRSVESDARIRSEATPGAIVAMSYAVERNHAWGDLRMAVHVNAPSGQDADALRTAIEASPLLTLTDDVHKAAARASLIAPRTEVAAGDPVPQLGALSSNTWGVVKTDGVLMMPPKSVGEVADIVRNLEIMVRYRTALALDNPDIDSRMRGKFDLKLLRLGPDDKWIEAVPEPASGQVVYEENDRIALVARSTFDKPAFIYLLDFGLTGKVKCISPSHEKLEPGIPFEVGKKAGKVGFPKGFPFDASDGPAEGIETFKLIVTEQPVDFSFLEQREGVRSASGRGPNPFDLLRSVETGQGTRDFDETADIGDVDWTTVVRPIVLRRKQSISLSPDAPATIGGATIVSNGIDASAQIHNWGSDRAAAAELRSGNLSAALAGADIDVRRTLEIGDARPTRSATRAASGPPSLDVTLQDPGLGNGQMIMMTDELGVISWHFAPPAEPEAGTRGATGGPRVYRLPGATMAPPTAEQPMQRGLTGIVGRKFIKELVFPLIDPVLGAVSHTFAAHWEAKHRPYRIRTFTPDDYANETATPIDGEGWGRLAQGRSLLMIHGTFSRAHTAFGSMSRELVESLHRKYDGRVWALDHYTLSHDPRQNLNWLLDRMPGDINLDFDIICHSRGGLVSRMLTEKLGEIGAGSRQLRVGNVIFVGSPNAGTILADGKHIGDLIDTYTNLLNFLPDNGVSDILAAIVTVAKQIAVGAIGGLPGLEAMTPDGKFSKWMNEGKRIGETHYFAVSSDYSPSEPGLAAMAKNRLMDAIFKSSNDLVVPTNGVFDVEGSGWFPIEDRVVHTGSDAVAHTTYFQNRTTREKIIEWLQA